MHSRRPRATHLWRLFAAASATCLLALAAAVPAAAAGPTAPATCTGTTQRSSLVFKTSIVHEQHLLVVHRDGGQNIDNSQQSTVNSTKQSVTVYYCKPSGSSTWKLWSWSTSPVYGSATVTISNDKIVNASGPLTLVSKVGSVKRADGTFDAVFAAPFACVNGTLTASMKAQNLAKFVIGLPIPTNAWIGAGAWAVSSVIPSLPTPRDCATDSAVALTFRPSSIGIAMWASSMASGGVASDILLQDAQISPVPDPTVTEYEIASYQWKITHA